MKATFSLLCLFLVCSISASSASSVFPHLKFQSWFSAYSRHFHESSVLLCNHTLQEYLESNHTGILVAIHADCVLGNTTETIKANMASAGVILGLMPTVLSTLGPTLSESAILMYDSPFLAILLALGAPAVWSGRPFEQYDALEALKQPRQRWCGNPTLWTSKQRAITSLLQYLLALLAAANLITASLELGMKTVLSWKKANSFLPLMWVLLTIILHVAGVLRLYLLYSNKGLLYKAPGLNADDLKHTVPPPRPQPSHSSQFSPVQSSVVAPPSSRTGKDENQEYEAPAMELLASCLPLLGLMHLFLGTSIFSSLLFIGVNDTASIVLRFSLSAVVVQLIRKFELGRLQGCLPHGGRRL